MATVAIRDQITDLDVYQQFVVKPRRYVVVNGTDEELAFQYDGTSRIVPAYTEIIQQDKSRPHMAHSWYGPSGEAVPGTLQVEDIYERSHISPEVMNLAWDAREALIHALGITRDGKPSAPLYEKGLTLMPGEFTMEQLAAAKAKSRYRYERWLIKSARDTVAMYDGRNDARRRAGLQDVPGGKDYVKAVSVLRAEQQREQIDAERALGIEPPPVEDLVMYARRRVADLAKEAVSGTGVSEEEAAEQLAKDPEVAKLIEEEHRTKRRNRG